MIYEEILSGYEDSGSSLCHKDLGASKQLRHYSRGHLFICRPCGHTEFAQPIYK